MKIEQDYKLKIAVDMGFSASKVCVNGKEMFTIPSNIVEVTGKENYLMGLHQPGFISVSYYPEQKHLVGEQAASLLMDQSYKKVYNEETEASYDHFSQTNTHIHLMTCIGMALIKYSQYTMENNVKPQFDVTKDLAKGSLFKIYVILGYPHDVYSREFQREKPNLAKHHEFTIETEDDTYEMNFTIQPEHVMGYSQALAAYMGLVIDDKGNLDESSEHFKRLPALLIDGGWKTIGTFLLTKNLNVEQAESNKDYAMNNIYQKVVEEIAEKYERDDIKVYNIEQILRREGGEIVARTGGTTKVVNINDIFERNRDEVCQNMIAYLNEKHNDMLDIKEIVIGGGTGAAYHDFFMSYIKKEKGHLVKDICLIDYMFNGAPIDPMYAVAVGLYKVLIHNLNVAAEEE